MIGQELIEYLKQNNAWWKWNNHKRYAILSSGAYSNFYVNCTPILCNPSLLQRMGSAMMDHVKEKPTWVFGPAYGGIALAHQIAMRFTDCKAGYAEKTTVSTELRTISRFTPFMDSPTILFCEDVVTSLSSILKMKTAFLEECPDAVILPEVLTIVNRSGKNEIKGFKISSLINVEAKTWEEFNIDKDSPNGVYPKKNWELLNERR